MAAAPEPLASVTFKLEVLIPEPVDSGRRFEVVLKLNELGMTNVEVLIPSAQKKRVDERFVYPLSSSLNLWVTVYHFCWNMA